METRDFGIPTLHTRVESWECDYNGHWNTRFYGRSFQLALETMSPHVAGSDPAPDLPAVRHIRFHRELLAATNIEIRSARLRCTDRLDGAVVHLLSGNRGLAATALDLPGIESAAPEVTADTVRLALPRGIDAESIVGWGEPGPDTPVVEFGPIRPYQCDHTESLLFEELIRCGSTLSSRQMQQLGLTPELTEKTRISRMAVELRVTRHRAVRAGTRLRGQSKLAGLSGKSIRTDHRILAEDDRTVATLEFCLVTVDIDTRRAVPVPREILEASRTPRFE